MFNYDTYTLENSSIWSFPSRGNWSTHTAEYRGNWSPYVPRNIILRYSNEGDLVLDPFIGGGTTAIEALLLNRYIIGVDINDNAVRHTCAKIKSLERKKCAKIKKGDACDLYFIEDNSIDLVCMHPPYANIISYSSDTEGDLSLLNRNIFLEKMKLVAKEGYRVLKYNKVLAIMIGDIREKGNVFPLGFKVLQVFLDEGFLLKEIVIKEQHNCRSTIKWEELSQKRNFLLLKHEYIFIFYKKE